MTEFVYPGVFVEEVSFRGKPIEGVSTSTAAFVGRADAGPSNPVLVTSLPELERTYGEACALSDAARAFFASGGRRLFVQRVGHGDSYEDGLRALESVGEVALVAAPGAAVVKELVEHAERTRYRFAVLDGPATGIDSSFAAVYRAEGFEGPASGYAAGIYARTDPVRPSTEDAAGDVNIVRRLEDGSTVVEGGRTLSRTQSGST
jgi:Bacteriophage tail sheath protein